MRMPWAPEFRRYKVNFLQEKALFSGYHKIKQFILQLPLFNGGMSKPIARELLCRNAAIAVLLYDPDSDTVVMIEQFRIGAIDQPESPWLLEIVAGVIDSGESPEETIYREVYEETGCKVLSYVSICEYYPSPGTSNEKIHLYCARVQAPKKREVHGLIEEGEDILVHGFKREEAFALLTEGTLLSSPAIIALQWLKINGSALHFPQ